MENKLREIIGDVPLAGFSLRRPATAEEAQRWKDEGVVVNPPSLDFVVREAYRRHAEVGKVLKK